MIWNTTTRHDDSWFGCHDGLFTQCQDMHAAALLSVEGGAQACARVRASFVGNLESWTTRAQHHCLLHPSSCTQVSNKQRRGRSRGLLELAEKSQNYAVHVRRCSPISTFVRVHITPAVCRQFFITNFWGLHWPTAKSGADMHLWQGPFVCPAPTTTGTKRGHAIKPSPSVSVSVGDSSTRWNNPWCAETCQPSWKLLLLVVFGLDELLSCVHGELIIMSLRCRKIGWRRAEAQLFLKAICTQTSCRMPSERCPSKCKATIFGGVSFWWWNGLCRAVLHDKRWDKDAYQCRYPHIKLQSG
jgi:hypothetical protein